MGGVMKRWSWLAGVEKIYDYAMEMILIVLFSAMIILMFSEVVARHVLNSPIIWSEELGRMLFIWCIFLGGALAVSKKSHIAVDYFTQFIPTRLGARVAVLVNFLVMAALVFVLIMGTQFAAMNFGIHAYSIPFVNLGWAYLAVPFGALTMFVNLLRVVFQKSLPD